MSRIVKKAWPDYFQKIADGAKSFDLRLADFDIKEGDKLILKEWDPGTKEYTGREIVKDVSYVLRTKDLDFFNNDDVEKFGYQIISFK